MAVGVVPHVAAGLHVVDAGAGDLVAVDGEGLPRQRAVRPHRIEVAHEEDALAVTAPGRAGADMVAVAVAARHALDRGAERREILGNLADEDIDGRTVGARRLDLDPGADALEDLRRIDARRVDAVGVGHLNRSPRARSCRDLKDLSSGPGARSPASLGQHAHSLTA